MLSSWRQRSSQKPVVRTIIAEASLREGGPLVEPRIVHRLVAGGVLAARSGHFNSPIKRQAACRRGSVCHRFVSAPTCSSIARFLVTGDVLSRSRPVPRGT